jgi:proline iminopeptidase
VGASWGVTLGLVYAQRHPKRVLGMVLGAVTSGSRQEIAWIVRDMGRVFPREWERFAAEVPEAARAGDLAAAYARLLADPDRRCVSVQPGVVPVGRRTRFADARVGAEPTL